MLYLEFYWENRAMVKEKVKPSFFGKTQFLILRLTVYYTNPHTEEIGE